MPQMMYAIILNTFNIYSNDFSFVALFVSEKKELDNRKAVAWTV